MNNCPKCQQSNIRKAGKVKDRQRYKCRDCSYYYSVLSKSGCGNKTQKRQALELYLEGLGFRSIGRFLNFSHVTIHNWIKQYGNNLDLLQNNHEICFTEIDEMHSYVGSKKTQSGSGLLLIDIQKNSLASLLATERQRLERSSGIK
jgi:transposase-like protein